MSNLANEDAELVAVPLSSQAFRDVIGRFASGVTVITTSTGGKNYGSTASAVTSLTDNPPMLLICLNKSSSTAHAILESRTFAVNVLAEDNIQLASRFASKLPDKFEGVAFETDMNNSPLLVGAIAHLVCRVSEPVEAGTHYVFLAHVEDAVAYPGHPLAYFRGAFGRMQMAPEAFVLREVRERIINTVNDLDQIIDIEAWAHELSIDVDQIHRALTALTSEGLVQRKGGDFVIAPVPESIIFESYLAKLAIELGVAESSVGRVSKQQLTQLRKYMEATLDYVEHERFTDPQGWIEANERFHEYMVEMAGSKVLLETYRSLGLPGLSARTINDTTYVTTELLEDHQRLVEAYENQDLAAVTKVLRLHAERPRQMRARETQAHEDNVVQRVSQTDSTGIVAHVVAE